jgi:hypothetical protein
LRCATHTSIDVAQIKRKSTRKSFFQGTSDTAEMTRKPFSQLRKPFALARKPFASVRKPSCPDAQSILLRSQHASSQDYTVRCDSTAKVAALVTRRRRKELIMKQLIATVCWATLASTLGAQQHSHLASKPLTPEALQAEIEALKPGKLAWREIAWKSCLLEGLKESRAQGKPLLLWVFIDRPADDARC